MQLLISVTSAAEAQTALAGGADIIDVKNPAEGALGAAPTTALADVCAALPPDHLASAALGEADSAPGVLALAAYGAASFPLRYLKVGLRPLDTPETAIALLRTIQQAMQLANPDCRLIAVGYADAARIGTLSWRLLPEIGRAAGIHGCMIDTALKDGRRLFDYCSEAALVDWLADCREPGLLAALAGSLGPADLPALRRLRPDVAGFRGAACQGDRIGGQVKAELVANLRAGLAG